MNNDLVSLTDVLKVSGQQLRNKWCIQLLCKLHIIHSGFQNIQCNICFDNLKVNKKNDLILVNVAEKSSIEIEIQDDIKFKAPELISKNITSKAGDIWATGICICFINNLCFPWKTAANNDKKFNLWANEGIFPLNLNSPFSEIVKQMLCIEPKLRPSIKNVIKMTCDCKTDKNDLCKLLYFSNFYKMN